MVGISRELDTLTKEKCLNNSENFFIFCASWTKSNSMGRLCFISLTSQSNWKLGNSHEAQ